jgi:CRISPR-associated endonuclease Csn1
MIACVAKMAEYGMPWVKRRKFSQQEVKLEDFVSRQMNDTAYIAREVRQYLQCLYPGDRQLREQKVKAVRGGTTFELRWQWGLDSILGAPGLIRKERKDLRHHAIDAIVIALTNEKRLAQLARRNRRSGDSATDFAPWANFWQDVKSAVENVNVSHRVRRKVRGQLHDETHYGKPIGKEKFRYRKALSDLTWAETGKILDGKIRDLVAARVAPFRKNDNLAPGEIDDSYLESLSKKPPAAAWAEPLYLMDKNGGVANAIKRVRLEKTDSTIRSIRKGDRTVYVKPGNTHHVCLFKGIACPPGDHDRDAVFVDLLTATERKLQALRRNTGSTRANQVIEKTHPNFAEARFWMSLSKGEMILLDPSDPSSLYRYETALSPKTKQLVFRRHVCASIGTYGRIQPRPWTLNPEARKVTVDPLGRVRWAND